MNESRAMSVVCTPSKLERERVAWDFVHDPVPVIAPRSWLPDPDTLQRMLAILPTRVVEAVDLLRVRHGAVCAARDRALRLSNVTTMRALPGESLVDVGSGTSGRTANVSGFHSARQARGAGRCRPLLQRLGWTTRHSQTHSAHVFAADFMAQFVLPNDAASKVPSPRCKSVVGQQPNPVSGNGRPVLPEKRVCRARAPFRHAPPTRASAGMAGTHRLLFSFFLFVAWRNATALRG